MPPRSRTPPPSRSLVDALPPEALRAQIRDFIEFLRYNRNVSVHTARAYASDLEQFLAITAASGKRTRPEIAASDFTPDAIRAYLGELCPAPGAISFVHMLAGNSPGCADLRAVFAPGRADQRRSHPARVLAKA